MDGHSQRHHQHAHDDDPNVLHQFLNSPTNSAQSQHITSTQIKALRGQTQKGNRVSACLVRNTIGWLSHSFSAFLALLSPPPKARPTCREGHTPPSSWGHGFPTCIDCGHEIRSQDDLKNASRNHPLKGS